MIITADKKFLIERCEERGYLLEDVMPCVIEQNGDQWTIDTDHAFYPKKRPVLILFGQGSDNITTIG